MTLGEFVANHPPAASSSSAMFLGMLIGELEREGIIDSETTSKIMMYTHRVYNEAEAILESRKQEKNN